MLDVLQRHVNIRGHIALADMLSLYMHEQTCITRQEQARGRLGVKEGSFWPADELWGTVPRLRAWEKVRPPLPSHPVRPLEPRPDARHSRSQFSPTDRVDHVEPTCRFASSKSHPLVSLGGPKNLGAVPIGGGGDGSASLAPESIGDGWQRIEWNDKAALASREVGSVVRFEVEGSTIGVSIVRPSLPSRARSDLSLTPPFCTRSQWQWAGPPHGLPHELPGQASCWVDDNTLRAVVVDAFSPGVAGSRWNQVADGLSTGKQCVPLPRCRPRDLRADAWTSSSSSSPQHRLVPDRARLVDVGPRGPHHGHRLALSHLLLLYLFVRARHAVAL